MRSGLAAVMRRMALVLGLDRNPLRRPTDRAEAWIRIGLLAVFLIAGPIATLAIAHSVYGVHVSAISANAARAHATTASGQFTDTVVFTAVVTLSLLGLALRAVASLARRCLNRRRLGAWEAAWSDIEPRWTGRR